MIWKAGSSYSSIIVKQLLTKKNITVFHYACYFQDFVLANYLMFPKLKSYHKKSFFLSLQTSPRNSTKYLNDIPKDKFFGGIKNLYKHASYAEIQKQYYVDGYELRIPLNFDFSYKFKFLQIPKLFKRILFVENLKNLFAKK